MTVANPNSRAPSLRRTGAAKVLTLALATVALAGCKHDEGQGTQVAGWSLVDATQRHPIIVSEKPSHLTVSVPRYTQDLTPAQFTQFIRDDLDNWGRQIKAAGIKPN